MTNGGFSGTNGHTPSAPLAFFCRTDTVLAAVLIGEGVAVLTSVASERGGDALLYLGLASLFNLWVVLLSAGTLCSLQRWLTAIRPAAMIWVVLATVQLFALLVGFGAHLLLSLLGWATVDLGSFLLRIATIAAVAGLLGLLTFEVHYRSHQLALGAKQSELAALQARVQPHFLFNSLNTAAALVHDRPADAERVLETLSDMFRAALSNAHSVPLADELALVRHYLEIEQLRMPQRLQVEWTVPQPLPSVSVPSLSIQPLVENAVRHGIESSRHGGVISIIISEQADAVTIRVENPMPAQPTTPGHGVGIAGVHARIEAATAGLGRLETRADAEHYRALLTIPRP